MKPLLIIKAGDKLPSLAGTHGDFEDWMLAGMGMPWAQARICAVHHGESLPGPNEVCGVLVTGSGAMVTDKLAWSEGAAQWLAQAVASDLPILGICYGHQLLAHALGGRVADNPAGIEVGTVTTSLSQHALTDPLFTGLPDAFLVQASHKQSVVELPPDARALASSTMDRHHAFAFGSKAWGLQFHPEFDEHIVGHYIDYYAPQLTAVQRAVDVLHEARRATPLAASLLQRFASLIRR
jgi:GMP synthase (glutamine-hydrolysing)